MRSSQSRHRGFTIIEILVAILLLSSALVAIFGAQFSAVSSTNYARNITQATQLARCRMSELELLFIEEGFQEGDIVESGECCEIMEGNTQTEFSCEWHIETVEFPDMSALADAEDDDELEDDPESRLSSMMGSTGLSTGADALGGGTSDLAAMGMGMVTDLLPLVTDMLEQAIRRVSVKVVWKEGAAEKSFEIVQYVTNPAQGELGDLQEAGAAQRWMDEVTGGEDASGGGNASGRGNAGGVRNRFGFEGIRRKADQ